MSSKNKIVLIVFLISILVVIGLFYYTLKNTSKDISDKEPFTTILNKKLVTLNDAIYIESSSLEFVEEYPNELQDFATIDTSKVKFTLVPKGSLLEFQKAVEVNRAVSGSKYAFLLGEVTLKDTNVKLPILYHWGTFKTVCIEQPCDYWEYRKAPWQN